ncbi:unnamed protein product [Aspergillus niger]|nr:unnamed protein product [Aspergillus niger]
MHSISALLSLLGGLALSSAAPTQNITSDAYFYGQSPAVYPSPEGTGTGSWASAYEKAKAFVAQLTDDEKVNLTAGVSSKTGCSGFIAEIPRLNFTGLCRGTDYVNGWSSGIHVGASWNRTLARDRAKYMGQEFHRKGVNLLLGPVVGPLGRVAEGGRNWEGFSNDPYLTGALVYETVQGVQSSGVGVSTKHYIGNEQETNRNPETVNGVDVASVSSNIDDKTIHELYLWPFQDAVLAGSVAIMCSYERINNSYACQNSKTLNGLLKTELGFQGYVITDWGAQHGGIASANAGLDMVMPETTLWGSNLTTAIANGTMEASRLDDMATRIIATWYQLNQDTDFPTPGVGMPASAQSEHQVVVGTAPDEKSTLLESAIEGHVLVKNTNNALPLQTPQLVSVFGYDAKVTDSFDLASTVLGTSPLFQNYTLWVGGGSGSNSPAYVIAPLNAIQQQAYGDGTSVLWDVSAQDPEVDPTSEACLVFINSFATEGYDRSALTDDYSDTLVTNVASKCNNTIVVVHNAGIRLVYNWIDHENVTAVVLAHLPGQDTGHALVDILYGRANPSGKLPYTIAKQASDYGSLLHPSEPQTPYGLFPQSDFSEGVYIDYRAFDKDNITPQFEFGFGLSYTTFAYSGLSIEKTNETTSEYPPSAAIQEGGNPRLWDDLVTVTAEVQNSGSVDGAEVAQLYVGIPNGPVRQLRGFDKVLLSAGETAQVSFSLNRRDLSTWNVEAQQWQLQSGTYQVYVGRSSRDLPLTGEFSI